MKKVLVTDIDGTFIHYDERDEKNIKHILEFKKKNNLIVACTGRSLGSVALLEKEKDFKFDYYIVLNGAMIADSNKKIIHESYIDSNIAVEIIKLLEEQNQDINVCINNGDNYYHILGDGENMYIKPEDMCINQVKNEKIAAILVNYKKLDGREAEVLDLINEKISEKYSDIVIGYRNRRFIDIVAKNASKGDGVNKLEDYLKVNHKSIYTIGDA